MPVCGAPTNGFPSQTLLRAFITVCIRKQAKQHDAISLTCGGLTGLRRSPRENGEAEKPFGSSGGRAKHGGGSLGWAESGRSDGN